MLAHLHSKVDKSGDAVGAAAELQLSKMREGGIHDLQVESLNEFVESYFMWNAAQPAPKVRAPTLVHQDYISVFKKWGVTVFNEYEIKRLDFARRNGCAHPSTDLDLELDCVRLFLDERSTIEATARTLFSSMYTAPMGACAGAAPFASPRSSVLRISPSSPLPLLPPSRLSSSLSVHRLAFHLPFLPVSRCQKRQNTTSAHLLWELPGCRIV